MPFCIGLFYATLSAQFLISPCLTPSLQQADLACRRDPATIGNNGREEKASTGDEAGYPAGRYPLTWRYLGHEGGSPNHEWKHPDPQRGYPDGKRRSAKVGETDGHEDGSIGREDGYENRSVGGKDGYEDGRKI